MQRRDPLPGLGGLLTLLGLLVFSWAVRQPPPPADCGISSAPRVREAWLVGLEPAAFVAACGCAYLALWASAGLRGGARPRSLSVVLAAVVLLLGVSWWIAGEQSPVANWLFVACIALFPSVLLVPTLIALVAWFRHTRDDDWAWRTLRFLCWWAVLILIPAFVGVISSWGEDFYC